jgi:hypothetical protein
MDTNIEGTFRVTREQLAQMLLERSSSQARDLKALEQIAARIVDELRSFAREVTGHRELDANDERYAFGLAESAAHLVGMLHATTLNAQKRPIALPPVASSPAAAASSPQVAVHVNGADAPVVAVPTIIVPAPAMPVRISKPPPPPGETCKSCFLRAATMSCSVCGVPTCEPCRSMHPTYDALCGRCFAATP